MNSEILSFHFQSCANDGDVHLYSQVRGPWWEVYDQHRHSPSTSDKKVTLEERQSGWLLRGRAHLPPCFSTQATSWVRCFRVLQTHQRDSCGTLPRLSHILAVILLYCPRLLLLVNKVYFKKEYKAVSSLSYY